MNNKLLRQKIVVFLLLIIAGTSSIAQTEQKITANWNCFEYNLYSDLLIEINPDLIPIVRAWIYSDGLTGKIKANGIVQDAQYALSGLTHVWFFDFKKPNEILLLAEDHQAEFRIEPDGTGSYFYFGKKKSVIPSLTTNCKKIK